MQKMCSNPQTISSTACMTLLLSWKCPSTCEFYGSHFYTLTVGKDSKRENRKKEQFKRHKYFSCVLHWCLREEEPNFKLCFSVGENDFPSKGFLSPAWSPGAPHPFAEMTFTWQMVQIAWHALHLLDQYKDKICQMVGEFPGRSRGPHWLLGGAELPKIKWELLSFLWGTFGLQLPPCWVWFLLSRKEHPCQKTVFIQKKSFIWPRMYYSCVNRTVHRGAIAHSHPLLLVSHCLCTSFVKRRLKYTKVQDQV